MREAVPLEKKNASIEKQGFFLLNGARSLQIKHKDSSAQLS